jgi:hypothetical protein
MLKYVILEFTPSTTLLYPPPCLPGIVSTGLIFHLHPCAGNIFTTLTLLYTLFQLPLVTMPPYSSKTCSAFLFSDFVNEKNHIFLVLDKSSYTVCLRYFHAYMYYNTNWIISSIFLHSTLVIFFFFFLYLYVHALFGTFLPPALCPLLLPPTPLASRQNLFCTSLQFYWRDDISNDKKDIVFLLVEIMIAIQRDS